MSHIINLMTMLEYNVDYRGSCYGIVHSAIRAQLQSQESLREWLQIRRFIVECPNLGALAKSVQEVRTKRKKGSYRGGQKKVEHIIEKIPAFLDTIQLYQASGYIDPLRAENTVEKNHNSKNLSEHSFYQNYAKFDRLFQERKEAFGDMLQVSCGVSFAAWLEARGVDCDAHVAFEINLPEQDHAVGLCCLTDDHNNSQWVFINHDHLTIVPRKKGIPSFLQGEEQLHYRSPSFSERLGARNAHFYNGEDIELIQQAMHGNSVDLDAALTDTQVLSIHGISDRPQKKSFFTDPLVFLPQAERQHNGSILLRLSRLLSKFIARERFILAQTIIEKLPHKNKLSYLLHDSASYSPLHLSCLHGNNALICAQLQGLSHEDKALYLSYPSKHEQVNALHIAASNNRAACLETMLQSVDGEGKERILSAQDPQGYTALHWAVANKALESIATLTKYMSTSCQALRNHVGKTAADMTTDPQIIQWLSNHRDSFISESPQALPTTLTSPRDTMDELNKLRDGFQDSKDLVQPHVYDTKNPKDDEEGPKQAKGSFK